MENPKTDLLQRLRDGANVLVTVSNNPSVDQLAGAIGLTLLLNKLGKHATAVFSGQVPDVLEFLRPSTVIEKNTDSLRDFIIALDKAKADKLRYKVEDNVVRIFITPYHTALTEKDLEFSQGDFNVDVVVAIGAHQPTDLDKAITAHGRILHDATVSSINTQAAGNLGTINWVDATASSLCEMLFDLCNELQANSLDPQIATAFLTGIVAETHRFGNNKTTAKSLETSSLLVAAGANQQLVATKLEEKPAPIPEKKPAPVVAKPEAPKEVSIDTHKEPEAVPQTAGTVTIDHDGDKPAVDADGEEIHIDEDGTLKPAVEAVPEPPKPEPVPEPAPDSALQNSGPKFMAEPPSLGGELTANTQTDAGDNSIDPLSSPATETAMPLLSHESGPALPPVVPASHEGEDLDTVEHTATSVPAVDHVDAARDAVMNAMVSVPDLMPKPVEALNAQHVDLNPPAPEPTPVAEPAMPTMSFSLPPVPAAPQQPQTANDPNSPPPVPPPMLSPALMPAGQQNPSNTL